MASRSPPDWLVVPLVWCTRVLSGVIRFTTHLRVRMPTPAPDRTTARCLNVPDRGVAPGAATRLPRWRPAERSPAAPSPRAATEFPTSQNALPQADGAA